MKKRLGVFLLFILLFSSVISVAQYRRESDPYDKDFFLTAHGGMFFAENIFSIHTDLILYNQAAWFESNMKITSNFTYGGGFGFFILKNLGLRFDVDIFSADFESDFSLGISSPWIPGNQLTVSTTVTGISSSWTAINADLIFRQKIGSSFVFTIGSGITYWMTDIYVPENYTWQWIASVLTLVDIEFEVYEANQYSFNILGGLEFYISDDVAISAEARYSHAEEDIEVPRYISEDPIKAKIGGLLLTLGFNMHF